VLSGAVTPVVVGKVKLGAGLVDGAAGGRLAERAFVVDTASFVVLAI
jgi:hypothetical protein